MSPPPAGRAKRSGIVRPTLPPPLRLPGVVLARSPRGESDVMAVILTRERGLVAALAKNARQSVRRFGGGLLEPGASAWYLLRRRPGAATWFLERGEANPKAPVLPPDPVVRTLAAWALELVMAFEARDNPAPEPFNLLLRHLADLAGGGRQAPPALAGRAASAAFTKLYLELAGFGTDFTRCRLCGRTGLPLLRLSAEAKGPLCPDCAKASGRRNPAAPAEFIGSLALVHKRGDLPILSEEGLSAAETYFRRLAALESGRAFKSPRVLRQLLEEAPGPPATHLEAGGPLDKTPEAPAGPSARSLETGGPLDEAPEAPAGPSARTLETGGPLGGLA